MAEDLTVVTHYDWNNKIWMQVDEDSTFNLNMWGKTAESIQDGKLWGWLKP
jgi:hypothetical protein